VVGLRQSEETDKLNYPIRESGSVYQSALQPHESRNAAHHLGGKIVSIQP